MTKLRGPKGTFVNIGVRRKGFERLLEMKVMRDQVSIPSVSAVFMIDSQTGYVGLTEFAEHTDEDLGNALETLTKQGMKRLVLDLRGNPGGQLDQAIRIVNRFVPQGSMVVYTRGRVANSDQDYRATENSEFTTVPMITLVNRNSASASEIVSGALQDYDRSLVIGETTFGKALVQSVYRVSGGAGLALTTARYYTPSGRLIQRPWDGTFDEYLTYTLKDQSERTHSADQLKYTTGGRKVYSGGGIEPDERFDGPIEGFNPTRLGRLLYNRQLFATYAEQYSAEGDTARGRAGAHAQAGQEGLHRGARDGRRIQGPGRDQGREDRRGVLVEGPRVHPRHDSLQHRRSRVRHRHRPAAPDHGGPPGQVRHFEVPGSRKARRNWPRTARQK